MRKIIVSMNVTLDGFMSGPGGELDWHFPFWIHEMTACACEQLSTMDTILVGRITYQSMAAYWPSAAPGCFAGMMNSYTKIVVSATLQKAGWNNTCIIKDNIAREITSLKNQPGKNIVVYGSGSLVSELTLLDMIDEYRIWVHPVVLGKGHSLFNSLHNKMDLALMRTKIFGSGVILLYYQAGNKHAVLQATSPAIFPSFPI